MASILRNLTQRIAPLASRNLLAGRTELGTNTRFLSAFVQQPAPDFKGTAVVEGRFKNVKLEDYKGNDRLNEFKAIDTEVVAVSVDSHFSHLAWTNTPRKQGGLGDIQFPILSDLTKKVSEDYGVLLKDGGIALRGLFIIDPNGIVRQITINDLPVGRSVDETLRLIKAFKYTDQHGEVCPANWEPNKPTINPKNAKEYFEKQN